jgi:hypothetical protein
VHQTDHSKHSKMKMYIDKSDWEQTTQAEKRQELKAAMSKKCDDDKELDEFDAMFKQFNAKEMGLVDMDRLMRDMSTGSGNDSLADIMSEAGSVKRGKGKTKGTGKGKSITDIGEDKIEAKSKQMVIWLMARRNTLEEAMEMHKKSDMITKALKDKVAKFIKTLQQHEKTASITTR